MKYFKKIRKREKRVYTHIPEPIPFFKKPSIPKMVFFNVNKINQKSDPILFLS